MAEEGLEPTRVSSTDFESVAAAITPLGLVLKMRKSIGLEPMTFFLDERRSILRSPLGSQHELTLPKKWYLLQESNL